MRGPDVVMFVGPTLGQGVRARALAAARGVRLRPPVQRRDLSSFLAKARRRPPGVICIVDGVFHDRLAVGHAEIRATLDRGWRVWGLSSMGAIRAREMRSLGMCGFGRVYELFDSGRDFQDDEVALLHEPTAPYRPMSEPLVHLRAALEHLVAIDILPRSASMAVAESLKRRWFGDRTMKAMLGDLHREGVALPPIINELRDFSRFRLKTIDLEQFLESAPWGRSSKPKNVEPVALAATRQGR
jgi:hypothetical protein